ncbi:MAG: HAD-IC family P-type ATPase, partial [Euryarchaeota archaeon]|nr:HAD-IC family P-type ATPase [Euryarchaeota archaeon]
MNKSEPSNETAWYQLTAEQVFKALRSGETGLTSEESKARLDRYGYNELTFKKRSALVRFLMQFKSPLIYILLASATITSALSLWAGADMRMDTVVIVAVVIANTIIGYIQEGKAEASVEALEKMMTPECTVVRDGGEAVIQALELVPGDVVILEGGDKVPADMRLFHTKNLSADEAAITGESVPVTKHTDPIAGSGTIADQRCMVWSGTFVTKGVGQGIVVGTGEHTEIGRIAKLLKETEKITTPLTRKMEEFTRFLIIAILAITVLNFVLAIWFEYGMIYAFLASVSLAVAAIPEGLPAVMTMALAIGVTAMARKDSIVKRLPAAETLGSTTVICSDKTGTLTKNQMTVSRIYSGGTDYRVSGVGYKPEGEFTPSQMSEEMIGTLKVGYFCNNAKVVGEDGHAVIGDPTEGALLVSAMKAGIGEIGELEEDAGSTQGGSMQRLDEMPFDSGQQYMATLHEVDGERIIYVKGSPERVIGMCRTRMVDGSIEPMDKGAILEKADEMAEEALRLLAMAYKVVPPDRTSIDRNDLSDMTFLGIEGMIDPPRDEAVDGVRMCKSAGVRVVMVTGDHAKTAKAIAGKLGIGTDRERALTGDDLSQMSDDELYDVVEDVSVYARALPEHKFRIVRALQKHGEVVAVTGDGVNDAPALKAADIGIAMGITGTEVSKEASDMILADDNFATIVSAVEEGRHVYNNIKKVILYTLPTNGGQAILIIGAILLAPFLVLFHDRLPLEPVQILWINLFDAVALALPLIMEPMDADLLKKPPRNPDERITDHPFFRKVGLISIVMAIAGFAIYYYYGMPAIDGELVVYPDLLTQAQTAAFTTVVLVHLCYLMTARSITDSAFTFSPFSNRWLLAGIAITIVVQLAIVYHPIGNAILGTKPLPLDWWGLMILLALPGFFVIEIEKW